MARNGRALHHSLISNKNVFFLIKLIIFLLQLFSLAFVFFILFVWNVPKLLILKVYIGNMFFCGNNKKQKLIGRPQFWKGRKVYRTSNRSFVKKFVHKVNYDVPSLPSTWKIRYKYSAEILEKHSKNDLLTMMMTILRALKSTTVFVQLYLVELATVNSLSCFDWVRSISAFIKVV